MTGHAQPHPERSFPADDPTNQTLIGAGTPTSFVLEFNTPGTILEFAPGPEETPLDHPEEVRRAG